MVEVSHNIGTPAIAQNNQRAIALAEKVKDVRPFKGNFPIPGRLKKLKELFQAAYNYFESTSKTAALVSPASDWLLDNFYILEQALRVIEEDLPSEYYARLPKTKDGWPRIQLLTLAVADRAPRLDLDQIRHFVNSFQSVSPLEVGELWALPLLLRLTILETLADGLAGITKLKWDPAPEPAMWKEFKPISDDTGPDADTCVINSILNLRLIATIEWKDFFEETSVLNRILQSDPAGLYSLSDFETRNMYRGMVEELARSSSMNEFEVAERAIDLALSASSARERHVGFYLIAEGRSRFEKQIGFRPSVHRSFLRLLWDHPTTAYVGSITLITLLILVSVFLFTFRVHGSDAQIMTALLLTILPASAVAVQLVNWVVGLIIPPRRLPKLDLKDGVPPEYRTMVVIPALLATEKDVNFLARQIENHFVANSDPNIFFALLTDFSDAPEKNMPQDDELLDQATARIKELNEVYGRPEYQPFLLFHRERIWNPGEESWMGWERKRGKLEEFNELLRGSTETTYTTQIGDIQQFRSIRFVITLDADTLLPRESARRLIGTLGHVLNGAVFDETSDSVKAGYTILQPRVQVRPAVVNQSLFTRTYAGDAVIDLYSRAVSDVYQDLFGEGNFVGKGIYDVDAFRRSLHDKVPENRLLSHDLFEALQGRCGLVTDVILFEDYPPHYLAYTDRLNRWVRGDWQLLPWLGRWVPNRTAGLARSTLSPIDRWRILDNLRRSLVALSIFALLVTGWLYLPGSKLIWTLVALAPYILPILTGIVSELRRNFSEEYPKFEFTLHPADSHSLLLRDSFSAS